MCEVDERLKKMHLGRLIHILSHQMKRSSNAISMMEGDELTVMQKHVLKFILLETLHRDIYQKDIEEEFRIRKSTVTGILQLMEKKGFIYREYVKRDARLKRIVPTKKAEALRPSILEHIEKTEASLMEGIPEEEIMICKKVLCQMFCNIAKQEEKNRKVGK